MRIFYRHDIFEKSPLFWLTNCLFFFFTISLVLEITSHQQVPFERETKIKTVSFYLVAITSNYPIYLGATPAKKNLLYLLHFICKAHISPANEVLCAKAPGQNATKSNKINGS